ncbi:Membrane associated serine protease, rhomboid family [Chitinophaga sp. CF118]|uniref:rhomboid family intramembrane serine protease n=1 Tax=Chitinophaga sp. CF118 TaxID=1884367 RepID=UPI0008E3BD5B|nr:rhomboid family intramembrane serine protease [Chitinophaga sp. CF118]SFF11580.1 Membrane associated serine protease, rhomboid family [Chitinophaga sp. CF118]
MEYMTLSIAIIIITCLVSITVFNSPDKTDELSMWPYMVKEKRQYYRFLTSGLVHGDIMHLAFNMITLYSFGGFIESVFLQIFHSKLYYLLFYLLALVLSDIPSYIKHRNDYSYRSIGASGAVSAVVFAAILFSPWTPIFVFFIRLPAIVYGVVYLGYTIYMSRRGQGSGIDHDAHLWGAVFGIIFPLIFEPKIGPYFLNQLLHHF